MARACLRGVTSERLYRGVVIYGEVMTLSLVVTYCLRSIITIAKDVSTSMSANTPASDSIIFIISSSINIFGYG